jgi:hypothetical protein
MSADPWQREFLLSPATNILLNCSRGAGKSRVTSALALHTALFNPKHLILLISRSQRQAGELYRYCKQAYNALKRPMDVVKETETQLELSNGSRIVALPGKEETIRSFQGVNLLVLDEAARIPDDLYASVRPMVSVSKGRVVCLSTPFGQRGFFWKEWHDDQADWVRFRIPWNRCPRHSEKFINEERRKFGDSWVAQEYECCFESVEGLVYPDFDQCKHLCITLPKPGEQQVGGIDWGFHNPFAALWGVLDHDDVLWINQERYLRETSLSDHASALPRNIMWYADPAGRTEIEEFRVAGHKVRAGNNDIRLGIQAVTARIRTGRLKVASNCVNLLSEAKLYRYPSPEEKAIVGENPIDDNNHALGALRYLVSRIDQKFIARLRKRQKVDVSPSEQLDLQETQKSIYGAKTDKWNNINNPEVWTTLQ